MPLQTVVILQRCEIGRNVILVSNKCRRKDRGREGVKGAIRELHSDQLPGGFSRRPVYRASLHSDAFCCVLRLIEWELNLNKGGYSRKKSTCPLTSLSNNRYSLDASLPPLSSR